MVNAVYDGITRSGRGGAVLVVYTAVGTSYVHKTTVIVHDSPTLNRMDVPPPSPPETMV